MKTFKINSMKTPINISLVLLLLAFACSPSGNKSEANQTNSTESISKIETPEIDLNSAVLTNNIEAVKQHIEAGTDINKKDAMSSSTPLITAASFGKTEITKILIDAGADLSVTNNDGATALHSAAFFCRVEIVQMLIDAKADKSLRNNYGATARESVMGPFEQIKPIYEMLQLQLEPMGLQIDLNHIEKTRSTIVTMLK